MFKFVLALTACYIVAECQYTNPNKACDRLLTCLEIYPGRLTWVTDEVTYTLYCQKGTNFTSCYAASKDECKNKTIVNIVKEMVLVTEHLCSTMEKDDFLAVSLSDCYTDQTIRNQVSQALTICEDILNAQRDSAITSGSTSVDCKVVEQHSACYLKGYTDQCGQKVGVLRHNLWSVLLPTRFESSNCGNLTEKLLTEKLG